MRATEKPKSPRLDVPFVSKSTRRKRSLCRLGSRITPKNRHKETNWGRREGKEVW